MDPQDCPQPVASQQRAQKKALRHTEKGFQRLPTSLCTLLDPKVSSVVLDLFYGLPAMWVMTDHLTMQDYHDHHSGESIYYVHALALCRYHRRAHLGNLA